jgi:carbon-monoxide dehydrogenase medium subunit
VPAADFFVTYLTTALDENEVLTAVRVPAFAPGTGWSIQEVARRHGDFAMVGAVATLRVEDGHVADPRIVLFGVGPTPLRATAAEQALAGGAPSEEAFAAAGSAVTASIEEPLSDVHASGEYRRHLADVLTRRALAEATGRAT